MSYHPKISKWLVGGTYSSVAIDDNTEWMRVTICGSGAGGGTGSGSWNGNSGGAANTNIHIFELTPSSPRTCSIVLPNGVTSHADGSSASFTFDGLSITPAGGYLWGIIGAYTSGGGNSETIKLVPASAHGAQYLTALGANNNRSLGQAGAPIFNAKYFGHGGACLTSASADPNFVQNSGGGCCLLEEYKRGSGVLRKVTVYDSTGAGSHTFQARTKWAKVIAVGAGAGGAKGTSGYGHSGRAGGAGCTVVKWFDIDPTSLGATLSVGAKSAQNSNASGGSTTFIYSPASVSLSATGGLNSNVNEGADPSPPTGGDLSLYPLAPHSYKESATDNASRGTYMATAPIIGTRSYGAGGQGVCFSSTATNNQATDGLVYIEEYS